MEPVWLKVTFWECITFSHIDEGRLDPVVAMMYTLWECITFTHIDYPSRVAMWVQIVAVVMWISAS